ncbi:NAD-dependent epimerase/dehydratase family protein [Nitrosopumilus sp.]|uniref:NAD-dependent epimerase/dehydratase family protein n=1 Tax=Nitrosopumilus sp. TaxID=2024843 RepID=UPI00247E3A02|nr:NAD-dependent epimerase/dehydratase family protein [Nitrosopumilus sp.]MCV0430365.1 NAD-dependent epimerase/dehydratase family protein [Nitrosopumilus sp.]
MKFVVTGGSGFIGSYIVKHLLEHKHEVTVIDNFWRGKLSNLSGIEDQISIKKIDILNFEELKRIISDSNGIFHQAALTSVPESFSQKEKYHQVNVNGTENIFKIAHEFGLKVVYASSSSVYGNTESVPIKEDFDKNPINPYGITKLEDEKLAKKYHELGVSIIGMRYFNVYGIGQTNDYAGVITKFFDCINNNESPIVFGDGSQVRDFVSVKDVAKANLLAMNSKTDFAFLNIGTGIVTSILDLAKIMIKLSGKSLEIKFLKLPEGDVKESQADVNLSKKLINWTYETPLEQGLKNFFFT